MRQAKILSFEQCLAHIADLKEIHQKIASLCRKTGVFLLYKKKTSIGDLVSTQRPPQPPLKTTHCVYRINCNDCDSCYIGETKRLLESRCREHRYAQRKMRREGTIKKNDFADSGMLEHALNRDPSFSFMDALVLKKEKHDKLRKFSEAIHILKTHSAVNASKGKQLDLNWLPTILFFSRSPISRL